MYAIIHATGMTRLSFEQERMDMNSRHTMNNFVVLATRITSSNMIQVGKRKRRSEGKRNAAEDVEMADGESAEPIREKRARGTKAEVRKIAVPPHRYSPLKDNWVGKRKRRSEGKRNAAEDVEMADGESAEPIREKRARGTKAEVRKIAVPPHRYSPLKDNWVKIFTPIVKQLHLQIRFNLKSRNVEIRNSPDSDDLTNLQKAADFVRAFVLGFDVDDALALVRLDHLFLESFEINDVKPLKGDHLSRAIGRIAGKDGRTKFTIENITKTRIVLADSKIHLLGAYQNIKIARNAISSLIMGSPPSKVYGNLRNLASRASERL
ncbi:RNA-binding protein pno1 [Toxocara canis]|uniref:RNA-binding protein pno-1 n=1 Tax=Toxocara canis TaxID=6265 RepID=A0A0B2VAI5_TOXCA|nr:RNA-binding protein pno1 [Toxocara canis]